MTREEAIKEIKMWGIEAPRQREVLETLIPELRESEDERIRKWIVNLLHELHYNQTAQPMALKAIEYLEKQKEQKPEQYDIDVLEKHITKDSVSELAHTVIVRNGWEIVEKEQMPDDDPLDDPKFLKGFDTGREVQRIFDEKKPAEWSEEDRSMLNNILLHFNTPFHDMNDVEKTMFIWLQSLPERFNLQPKQEWSKEDGMIRNLAIEWAETMSGQFRFVDMESTDFRKIATWLKSLRPQPKQEWSEDDEMMVKSIVNVLKRFEHQGATDIKIDWLQNKLKSLRPQPHWKPSDDQMIALNKAFNGDVLLTTRRKSLESLYEQLKKMM